MALGDIKVNGRTIMRFNHHGAEVFSYKEQVGTHRACCLCWNCEKFKPGPPTENCKIANLLFAVDLQCQITTPVFYCKEYEGKKEGNSA